MSADPHSVMDRVDSLRRQLTGLVTLKEDQRPAISWGCPELDQFMPGGSLQPGMMVELLYERRGSGATSLAMHCAKQAVVQQAGPLVVVDRGGRFYPPAAVARGIESRDLIMAASNETAMSSAEELWALDQALRCKGVAVVMAWIDKIDPHSFRRLQLAAEVGQTLALLIRPARVRSLPTWADVQLLISPSVQANSKNENRFCRATLLRQRGRAGSSTVEGTSLDLEINELATDGVAQGTLQVCAGTVNRNEARTMHMAPRVAHSADRRRSAGA